MILTTVEIKEAVLMALSSLKANKLRAGLTILGVMVGVSSVIAIASIVDGLDGAFNQEIDQIGSNIILVTKFEQEMDHDQLTDEQRNRPEMTVGEAEAILENCSLIDGVSPENHYYHPGGNEAKYRNRKFTRPTVIGTWPDFTRVNNKDVTEGRFINDIDERHRRMVCVIGTDVADVLFPEEKAVGREIRVNTKKFLVIGVLEEIESNFGDDGINRLVAMPLSTYIKLHPWDKALSLMVRAVSYEDIDAAKDQVTAALRIYRQVPYNKKDNFALSTQDQFKEFIANITKYLYMAALVITSVGLMVGGIGVMNIMLVSVTERTREIGIRKAIGAKRSNIIIQFLTEAMTLSGTGGLIGVVFGIAGGLSINALLGFPVTVSFFWMIVGFGTAVSVGLISGIYPAIKAAYLDPIEALHYE